MSVQIIRKNGEPEYAVVPYGEYKTLLQKAEALDEVAAFDRAVRELEEQRDEVVPASIAHRVVAGGNPIKVWREYRGLSQTALADRSGLSQSYVAMLEGGSRKGTTENLSRLAEVLDVELEHLLTSVGTNEQASRP